MIVNRATAEAALVTLGIGWPLDQLTENAVAGAYRATARVAHPDQGGSVDAFTKVGEAKAALVAWLAQRPDAPDPALGGLCPVCDGSGFVQMRAGFSLRGLRKQCTRCRGTGDINYEHEKGSE